jgi:hypothetical protein
MSDIKTSQELKEAIDKVDAAFGRVVRGLKRLETILSPEEMPKAPKPTGAPVKRPLVHKCSHCGEPGHNKRSCGAPDRWGSGGHTCSRCGKSGHNKRTCGSA